MNTSQFYDHNVHTICTHVQNSPYGNCDYPSPSPNQPSHRELTKNIHLNTLMVNEHPLEAPSCLLSIGRRSVISIASAISVSHLFRQN